MHSINKTLQQQYFDKEIYQYKTEKISRPSKHVQLETQTIIKRLKHYKIDAPIADFGAGTGRLTIPLLQAGFKVDAIDISRKSLAKLKQLAKNNNLAHNLHTRSQLPNKPTYAAIVGTDVLHHVDIAHYLPKLQRALLPNGIIIFSEPNALNLAWWLFFSWKRILHIEKGIIQCTYSRLQYLLEFTNYHNIKLRGFGLLPLPLFNWSNKLAICNLFLGNFPLLRYFAYRLIIEASKDS